MITTYNTVASRLTRCLVKLDDGNHGFEAPFRTVERQHWQDPAFRFHTHVTEVPMAERPRMPIRRFDVFADYNRVRNQEHGMPEDLAKGRALWAAKVVAGRRYGAHPSEAREARGEPDRQPTAPSEEGYRSVGGKEQTGPMFDREIVDRMGPDFYRDIFHPAIEQAVREGRRYEDIRDSIRRDW